MLQEKQQPPASVQLENVYVERLLFTKSDILELRLKMLLRGIKNRAGCIWTHCPTKYQIYIFAVVIILINSVVFIAALQEITVPFHVTGSKTMIQYIIYNYD